jgi:hypothetical protein
MLPERVIESVCLPNGEMWPDASCSNGVWPVSPSCYVVKRCCNVSQLTLKSNFVSD